MPEQSKPAKPKTPAPNPTNPTSASQKKVRGLYLTIWLSIVMLVFLASAIVMLAIVATNSPPAHAAVPFDLYYLLLLISVAGIACTYYLFAWKRWALYGIVCVTAVSFVVNVVYSGTEAILGLIGLLILVFLFRNKMDLLE